MIDRKKISPPKQIHKILIAISNQTFMHHIDKFIIFKISPFSLSP